MLGCDNNTVTRNQPYSERVEKYERQLSGNISIMNDSAYKIYIQLFDGESIELATIEGMRINSSEISTFKLKPGKYIIEAVE